MVFCRENSVCGMRTGKKGRKKVDAWWNRDFRAEVLNRLLLVHDQPRRTYKIKGDGNCYFRSISCNVLTGSENHGIIRDQFMQHMNTGTTTKIQHYLNQNVEDLRPCHTVSEDLCFTSTLLISFEAWWQSTVSTYGYAV